jgi:hypothetical protein
LIASECLVRIGIFLAVTLASAGTVHAEPISGRQLLTWCQSDPGRADTYIAAFNDTAQVARIHADESAKRMPRNATMYDEIFHRFVGRFCIPRQATVATTSIVCRWLSVHNDAIGMPAPTLIAQSYQNSFPCLDE